MNPIIKKWTATTLALAMAVSMGVSVSAKPSSSKTSGTAKTTTSATTAKPASASDYTINVNGASVEFVKNGKVSNKYATKLATNAKAPDMSVVLAKSGNLCLYFAKTDGKTCMVSLGKQANVVFTGDYNNLTIDTTVPNDRSFTVSGNVATLNVNAPTNLSIAKTATVNSLKVGNKNAKVSVESGAKVAAAAASNATSVAGMTTVATMPEVITSVTGVTAPVAGSSIDNANVTSGGLRVEMADASDTKKYAANVAYQSNNTITILPKTNASLANLMSDIKLTVYKADTNNVVTGAWKFIGGVKDNVKAVPGTYKYQFTPYQEYKGFDVNIQIVGAGSNAVVTDSPKISFYSGVGRGSGGPVDVDISLPANVARGDTLELHAGSWSTTKSLVTSDAGETNTYTVQVDENLSKNAKVKVYCVLHTGGQSLTSNTVSYTYNEDGDTKTLKKPGLSLSSSHGSGDFTAKVTLPVAADDADEVVITATNKTGGGSSREVGSQKLNDNDGGKSIEIKCSVSGDEDDEIKIKATLKSGGSSISSDTKTYRIA